MCGARPCRRGKGAPFPDATHYNFTFRSRLAPYRVAMRFGCYNGADVRPAERPRGDHTRRRAQAAGIRTHSYRTLTERTASRPHTHCDLRSDRVAGDGRHIWIRATSGTSASLPT